MFSKSVYFIVKLIELNNVVSEKQNKLKELVKKKQKFDSAKTISFQIKKDIRQWYSTLMKAR